MADLRSMREKYRNLKSEFDREKEIEFAKRSAVLQSEIDREIWRLRFEEGWSIARIGEQYGTKNYQTIKDILDRRPTPVVTENGVAPIGELHVARDVDNWILVLAYGERVYFQDKGGYPWFNAQDKDFDTTGQLANALRLDAEFYEQVLNMSEVEA
jgi:hypothetical protein